MKTYECRRDVRPGDTREARVLGLSPAIRNAPLSRRRINRCVHSARLSAVCSHNLMTSPTGPQDSRFVSRGRCAVMLPRHTSIVCAR